MSIIPYIFTNAVLALISALQLFIIARTIISLIMPDVENALIGFVFYVTEPVLMPVRLIIEKIPSLRDLPIDLSPIITYFILLVIHSLIGQI